VTVGLLHTGSSYADDLSDDGVLYHYPATDPEDQPFRLVEERRTTRRQVEARVGQPRFKFQVFERYGSRCAVCDISAPQLLDAAHLRPKKEHGSDDPRNGLVLCASHHRALDAGLLPSSQAHSKFASDRLGQMPIL